MSGNDKVRILSRNDLSVLMSQFLSAATDIHIAMAQFSDDHSTQANLNSAMHSALIGAEMCRQLHGAKKHRIPPLDSEEPGE